MTDNKIYFESKGPWLLKQLGMTKTEFARRMGIQKQNVNTLFASKNILVIRKASEVLGVPFELLVSYPDEPDFSGCTFYSDYVAQAVYLRVVIPYNRYDDMFTIVNDFGEELGIDDSCTIPFYDSENRQFDFTIHLPSHKIIRWNYNTALRIWAKVCDSGTYELQDKDGNPLLQIVGYVPNEVIPPQENGWGDYVEFCIGEDGIISNWPENPDLMIFAEKGSLPKPIRSNRWGRAKQVLWTIKNAHLSPEELEWIKSNI